MWSRSRYIRYALRLILSLSILETVASGCSRSEEPVSDHSVGVSDSIVFETDSAEWHVRVFATGKYYADAVEVQLPSPWVIPTREDAQILKTLNYPSSERFVTSDGYTFGMPSASVSKAGQKTRYSVLGLWKRPTVIEVQF